MTRTPEEHQAWVDAKRAARMDSIDALSPDMRRLVNEYGGHVVNSFVVSGVTSPKTIKHLVETVLDEFSPTRGSYSRQGASISTLNMVEPRK